ncbi:unnamed protein product, partial [Coregonus sp. 'balchen']
MVCGSHVHLNDPGKHCCGEETYDPQDEICCNGHKGKGYNPSSVQMKCFAGTLGSVLMEASSTQTCCFDPRARPALPYPLTCCGHRYPNASLWSCCAGVLHHTPPAKTLFQDPGFYHWGV